MSWLRLHWSQILVAVCSALVGAGLLLGKLTPVQAVAVGSALDLVGLHLPAIVYKLPPMVGSMLAAIGLFLVVTCAGSFLMLACATSAKLQYGGQLNACIDQAANRAEADSCMQRIRLEWDEAGAKPALVLLPADAGPVDGGGQ